MWITLALAVAVGAGCSGRLGGGEDGPQTEPTRMDSGTPTAPVPAVPGDRLMRRISAAEYTQSVLDVLEVEPMGELPADLRVVGLSRVGAGTLAVNALAAEQYEAVAHELGLRVFSDSARSRRLSGCTPSGEIDETCARTAVTRVGERLFRRAMAEPEVALYTNLAMTAAMQTSSFDEGLGLAVSAMLQSPRFLFHIEIGEPIEGEATRRRYTGEEMAARLASFLWNSVPDEALRQAAAAGRLVTDDGLRTEVTRMLQDARARRAIVSMLEEHLALDLLDAAVPSSGATAGIAVAMREEVRRVLAASIFDEEESFRDLFTRDRSIVNGPLAAHYGLTGVAGDDFREVTLPAERHGILSFGALLASHGHGGRTSPTLRGLFVRQRLLCTDIPPPPPGVATDLPLDSGPTARDRLMRHATDPTCAGCHQAMDPIGLAFEQFDAIAAFRTTENGVTIDTSGALDGTDFVDARTLGEVVAAHPDLEACMARTLFRAASGRTETDDESSTFDPSTMPASGLSVHQLLEYVVLSEPFRTFQPAS